MKKLFLIAILAIGLVSCNEVGRYQAGGDDVTPWVLDTKTGKVYFLGENPHVWTPTKSILKSVPYKIINN